MIKANGEFAIITNSIKSLNPSILFTFHYGPWGVGSNTPPARFYGAGANRWVKPRQVAGPSGGEEPADVGDRGTITKSPIQ